MKKVLTTILAVILIVQSIFIGGEMRVFASSSITRDTVLLLDCSGSMDGTPMTVMKEAAKKFCESVLAADGTNRVAIVDFESTSTVKSQFTNDLSALDNAIDSVYALGGTNTQGAIKSADMLMKQSSTAQIKNIVLLTDGLPTDGDQQDNGHYTEQDYPNDYSYANSAYSAFESLKDDYYFYTLGFFHSLSGNDLIFGRRFLTDIQNAGYYEVTDPSQLVFTFGKVASDVTKVKKSGTFQYQYPLDTVHDYSATYYYDDNYFSQSSYTYQQSLATMSLCLAMSAFGSNTTDYSNKSQNVKALVTDVGFTNFETNSWFQVKPTTDSIAVAAASKPYKTDDGEAYTLITAAVRGSGYGSEWASNLTLGLTGEHQGFSEARDNVLKFLRSYITEHGITGKIKLWITGYSRAAATANMTAGALDNGQSLGSTVTLDPEDLYAYCFETPAGSQVSIASDTKKYQNIFSIVNPSDPVPKVAPSVFSFSRYGSDKILPSRENDANYKTDVAKMLDKYNTFQGTTAYTVDDFQMKQLLTFDASINTPQTAFLDKLIRDLALGTIKTRANYVNTYQSPLRNVLNIASGTDSETWEAFQNDLQKHLLTSLADLLLQSANPLTVGSVPDTLKKLVVRSLNESGVTDCDQSQINDIVTTLLNLLTKFSISYPNDTATLLQNLNSIKSAHYPELCLAWMQSMDPNYTAGGSMTFQSSAYRVIHINCPVDVNVTDSSGQLVAQIISETPQTVDGSSIVTTINSNGEKLIYLPVGDKYTIKMTARQTCTVDYTVSEFSEEAGDVTRFVNYYDVPVQQGQSLTGTVAAYSQNDSENGIRNGSSTVYTLMDAQGNIITANADMKGTDATQAYYTITPVSNNDKGGTVYGGGIWQLGNYALVNAQPNAGYAFSGWYEGGNLVSTDASYRFRVMQDVTLTAKFTASVSDTQYKITVGNSKHGTIEVNPSSATGGAHVIVTATPDVGYVLKEIYVDGVTIKGSDFTVPTHDVTVTADFEPAAPSSSTSSETPSVSKGGTTPGKTSIVQKNGTTSSPEGGTSVISGSGSHIVNPDTGGEMGAGVVGVLAVFGVALVIITSRKRKRK